MKFVTVLLSIVFLTVTLKAQDKIYKKNGEIIEAKVLQITTEIITFKRFENLTGPEYSIPKIDVFKVKYSNGTQDIFEENNDKIGVNEHGKYEGVNKFSDRQHTPRNINIIAFAPLEFTENGYGFSLSYERTLDNRGWISFYCPVNFTFTSTQNAYTNEYQDFLDPMLYFCPGVKFYTNLNSYKRAKFSIGPNLVFGFGNGTTSKYDLNGYSGSTTSSRMLFGAMVTIGGNIFPTKHLFLGYDFGLGTTYVNDYDGKARSTTGLVQTSFRVGYRFTKTVY